MANPLIIFDCDGVLIDSEVIYVDVETTFLKEAGVDVERAWYVQNFMALGPVDARRKYKALVEEHTGKPYPDEAYDRMKDESRRRVLSELAPVDGVEAMLSALSAERCVASSTVLKFLHRKLEQVDLARFFGDGIYSGDQVEHGKPAPDLYLFAAREMGRAPSDCIVVEDSVNGVKGGKAAGMLTIGFSGGSHCVDGHAEWLREAGADVVIGSHAELSEWFAEQLRAA